MRSERVRRFPSLGLPPMDCARGPVIGLWKLDQSVSEPFNSADPRGGPQKHLRGPMIANHLGFDMSRVHTEMLAEVNAKWLTVEIGACAQHRRTGARLARDIGEGIRRIGHDEGVPHWAPPARSSARSRDR